MTSPVGIDIGDGVAVITIDSPPVNALSASVLAGLAEKLDAALGDAKIRAVVLTGAGGSFVAGADVTRLGKIAEGAPIDAPGSGPRLPDVIAALERSDKPTVAAVDGFALGGGLELALGCHARVGSMRARVGLPELELGLIPGAGGTQRLPRVAGVGAATRMMLTSRHVEAREALELGILDELVEPGDVVAGARRLALGIADGLFPLRRTLERTDKLGPDDRGLVASARADAAKRHRNVTHPFACLDAIAHGLEHGPSAGLEKERELFLEALGSEAARGLIHLFFAKRAASKLPGVTDAGLTPRPATRVAVIGGGTMGSGIATALVEAGVEVRLLESSPELAKAAISRIEKNVARSVDKGRLRPEQAAKLLATLTPAASIGELGGVSFVIEAATEDVELKRRLFAELARSTNPEAWLASNTSTIDIAVLGAAAGCPERVLGLHFFSPAHVMPLVEVVRTRATASQALVDALALCKRLKKTPVTATSCPGFLVNRIFMPYSQLTGFLIDRGVDPYRIDRALGAFGMPMGPNRMSDLAGVDVGVAAGGILDAAYPDRSYRSPLRRLLAEAGRLGEKSGRGHYRYEGGKALEDPALASFVDRARELSGSPEPISVEDGEIVELLLFGIVNEACRALDEGVVARPSDVDVAAVLGMGFPAYRGGPLKWADRAGARAVFERLEEWHGRFGHSIFAPSRLLQARAAAGESLLTLSG